MSSFILLSTRNDTFSISIRTLGRDLDNVKLAHEPAKVLKTKVMATINAAIPSLNTMAHGSV